MVVIVVLLILIVIGAGAFGGYCLVCVILLEDLRRGIYVALKIFSSWIHSLSLLLGSIFKAGGVCCRAVVRLSAGLSCCIDLFVYPCS